MFGISAFATTPFSTLYVVKYQKVISEIATALDAPFANVAISQVTITEIGVALATAGTGYTIPAIIIENANAVDLVSENMNVMVSVVEIGNAQDIEVALIKVAVQINEDGYAIDAQSETTYVILAVIENGNAQDVYYFTPIFRASGNVWHVSPRANYWRIYE